MSKATRTIYFEDAGQDFLEWDLDENDVVVESRPFQNMVWCGTQVSDIDLGLQPIVVPPHTCKPMTLNYAVIKIRHLGEFDNPFADPQYGPGVEVVSVHDRLGKVQSFDADDCRAALKLPDLQKTVRDAVQRRLKWVTHGQEVPHE